MRYRAFISYSHADAASAAWLHRKLEGWRVPARMRAEQPALPERLAPVFRDREELSSAGELGPQIQAALAESDALIVLCSPEAARSRWVDAEVQAFRRGGRGARVFALIVAGEPNSGGERECFPPSLREGEPLAADLRPGKDGKELALLKLIAGLLGVPLDALVQREARRRHQRMLAVTSMAVAVMLVTSVLAVQAMRAREAAERRQKQAEALVGFMLGDLNDKLTEVSRLDILERVHDQAMQYFRSLPDTDVTDEALEQRAHALSRMGNVRMDQGKLPKAMEAYLAAEKLTARLAASAPADVDRQLAHADAIAYLGTVSWYQGELDAAQSRFDQAAAVLAKARALAPSNEQLLFQSSTIDNNAGHVLEGRGRMEEANVYYLRMLGTAKALVGLNAGNVEWQNQLGLAHNNLAKMALFRGDLRAAVEGYRADVEIEARLAARDVRNHSQLEKLVISRAALGRTLALSGELEEGAEVLQLAVDEAERLRTLEPDSAIFAEDLGLYATQLARLRRLQGRLAEARALSARSLAALDGLLAKDADNPGWRRARAEALTEAAQQDDDRVRSAASLRRALAILESLLQKQPDDRATRLAAMDAGLRLAAAESFDGSNAVIPRWLAEAGERVRSERDPRLRALRVGLLLHAGRRADAHSEASALWREGYRDPAFAGLLRAHHIETAAATAPSVVSP